MYYIEDLLKRALAYGLNNEYAKLGFVNSKEAANHIYDCFFKNLYGKKGSSYYATMFAALEIQKGKNFYFDKDACSITVNGVTIYGLGKQDENNEKIA